MRQVGAGDLGPGGEVGETELAPHGHGAAHARPDADRPQERIGKRHDGAGFDAARPGPAPHPVHRARAGLSHRERIECRRGEGFGRGLVVPDSHLGRDRSELPVKPPLLIEPV